MVLTKKTDKKMNYIHAGIERRIGAYSPNTIKASLLFFSAALIGLQGNKLDWRPTKRCHQVKSVVFASQIDRWTDEHEEIFCEILKLKSDEYEIALGPGLSGVRLVTWRRHSNTPVMAIFVGRAVCHRCYIVGTQPNTASSFDDVSAL